MNVIDEPLYLSWTNEGKRTCIILCINKNQIIKFWIKEISIQGLMMPRSTELKDLIVKSSRTISFIMERVNGTNYQQRIEILTLSLDLKGLKKQEPSYCNNISFVTHSLYVMSRSNPNIYRYH